jgi:hypothetical protein
LNFCHLDFDIVSDLELKISDFASLGNSTSVENPLQIGPIMQNKPNFVGVQMNANVCFRRNYENNPALRLRQNKPNLSEAKMSVSSVMTKDYENQPPWGSKSNQTQSQDSGIDNFVVRAVDLSFLALVLRAFPRHPERSSLGAAHQTGLQAASIGCIEHSAIRNEAADTLQHIDRRPGVHQLAILG